MTKKKASNEFLCNLWKSCSQNCFYVFYWFLFTSCCSWIVLKQKETRKAEFFLLGLGTRAHVSSLLSSLSRFSSSFCVCRMFLCNIAMKLKSLKYNESSQSTRISCINFRFNSAFLLSTNCRFSLRRSNLISRIEFHFIEFVLRRAKEKLFA